MAIWTRRNSGSDVFGILRLITPLLLVYMPVVRPSTSSTTDTDEEGEPNNFPGFDGQLEQDADATAATATATTGPGSSGTADGAGPSEQDRADEARYNYNYNINNKRGRKNKSPIWEFFSIDPKNDKRGICSLCRGNFSRGGDTKGKFGTSNLSRHLNASHRIVYEDAVRRQTEAEDRRLAALQRASDQTFFGLPVGKKS